MIEYEKTGISNVRLLADELINAGCLYTKGDIEVPSKTGEFVYHMDQAEYEQKLIQAEVMGQFFAEKSMQLIEESFVSDWLGISQETIETVQKTNPFKLPWTLYFGMDYCGKPFVINDLNPDRAVVIGYQPEIAQAFSGVYPLLKGKTTSFYDDFVPLINNLGGKGKNVYVLTEKEDPHGSAYQKFASNFGFTVGDIASYDSSFDVVVRALKSYEILENKTQYKSLLADMEHGLPVINPLGSFIGGNKGWMSILRAKNLVPDDWFPDSWLIKKGSIMDQKGQTSLLTDCASEFLDNRKNFVLKEAFSAGGWKVHIGAELKKWKWKELWDQVYESDSSWVVENLQPKNEINTKVGEQIDLTAPLVIKEEKLNIIQRVYSVYPFENIHCEVFGKHGYKVNASGYSFPVSYDNF